MPKGCSPKPKGKDSKHYVHGYAIRDENNLREPIYICWVNLRQRCTNKNKLDYKFYGGRGIKVCKRWNSYKNFLNDMGKKYYSHKKNNKYTTLDRINVNKGYSPSNCRWATRLEQSNNRNYSKDILYRGKSQTIGKWIEELGIKLTWKQVYKRLVTRKWPIERAFNQPFGVKYIQSRWSLKYSKCIKCGTTKIHHGGYGLCNNCYAVEKRKRLVSS